MFKNIRKLNTISYIIIACFIVSSHFLTTKTCMVKASARELDKIQVEEHVQTIEYSKTYSGPPTITVNTLQNNLLTPTDIAEQYNYEVGYFKLGGYHTYGTPAFIHGAHYFNNV